MKTSRLLFKPLRGIDDSWRPSQNPPKALRIRDMRFNDKDAWQNSGGYKVLIPDDGEGPAWTDFSEIESVHWFSEHSGNRQHLIFEAKNATDMRLYVFDGTKSIAQKWRPIMMSDGTQAPARASADGPWFSMADTPSVPGLTASLLLLLASLCVRVLLELMNSGWVESPQLEVPRQPSPIQFGSGGIDTRSHSSMSAGRNHHPPTPHQWSLGKTKTTAGER